MFIHLLIGLAALIYLSDCAIGIWVRWLESKLKRVEADNAARTGCWTQPLWTPSGMRTPYPAPRPTGKAA